jgi:hypothetical protein
MQDITVLSETSHGNNSSFDYLCQYSAADRNLNWLKPTNNLPSAISLPMTSVEPPTLSGTTKTIGRDG